MSLKTEFRNLRKTLNEISLHYKDHPEVIEAIVDVERFIATFLQVITKDVDVKINWRRHAELWMKMAVACRIEEPPDVFWRACEENERLLKKHWTRIEADLKEMDEFDPREFKLVETAGKTVDEIFQECQAIESFGVAAKLDMQTKYVTVEGGWTKEGIADALELDRSLMKELGR